MLLKKIAYLMFALAVSGTCAQAQNNKVVAGKKIAKAVKVDDATKEFKQVSEGEEINPAEFLYSYNWDNVNLNPYDVGMPDSFSISLAGFVSPIEKRISSEYGPRWERFHAGVDIAINTGDSIRAAFDGKIRIGKRFNKNGYGWYVVIRHENGLETLYGHLKKSLVNDNQTVKAGDVIGLGGSTGRSTGPHLHFETRFLGIPMSPRNIINFEENVLHNDTYTIKKDETFEQINTYLAIKNWRGSRKSKAYRALLAHSEEMRKENLKVVERQKKMVALREAGLSIDSAKAIINSEIAEDLIRKAEADKAKEAREALKEAQLAAKNAKTVKAEKQTTQVNVAEVSTSDEIRTITHFVKSGDNLSKIARTYKTSVKALCDKNHINKDGILSLGQAIKIDVKVSDFK